MKKLMFGNSLMLLSLIIMVMCDLEVLGNSSFMAALIIAIIGIIMCIRGFFFDEDNDTGDTSKK